MLTASDIQLIVKGGEGYNTEFKVSVPSKVRDLTEEICAFANAAGGTPSVHCPLSFIEIDGKNLIVIEVPSGPDKPYIFSGSIKIL